MDEGREESCVDHPQSYWDDDEQPKDKIPKEEKQKKVEIHVTLRHNPVSGCEENGCPLNRKTDSEALESVYGYAKRIKLFLGWEGSDIDLRKVDGSDENKRNSLKGSHLEGEYKCCDRTDPETGVSEFDKDNTIAELYIDNKKDYEQSGENFFNNNNTGAFFSNSPVEYYSHDLSVDPKLKLQDIDQNSDIENINNEIDSKKEIFVSEITIYIEGNKDNKIYPPLSEDKFSEENKLDSVPYNHNNMDEHLVQEDVPSDSGLELSDSSSILKSEAEEKEAKPASSEDNCVKNNAKLEGSSSDTEPKQLMKNYDFNEKLENELISDIVSENLKALDGNQELEKDNAQPSMTDVRKLSIDVVKGVIESAQHSLEEILNKKYEENGILANTKTIDEAPSSSLDDCQKAVISVNDTKPFLAKINENSCINNTSHIDHTVKAHVQYKNDKNMQPVSKEGISEKQVMDCNDSLYFDEDTVCGIGSFRPQWMQKWATAKVYVILYSILGILHGSYYSYLIGTLSTLEKRFAFKSKISGAIMVADEFTPLFLGILVGYYAGKGHRPRIVALGMLLSAGCCFVTALPYFVYGPVQHLTGLNVKNETGPEYCDGDFAKGSCDLDDRPPTLPAVLFMLLGSFMKGFGNLAYYAIGLAYMDDNSEKKDTPIFLGIALALRLLGPLLGFLMSSGFLKLYENPLEDPGFGPDDPRWIGAWWMGFVVQGVLLVIFTLPIALFPRRLPSHSKPEPKALPNQTNKESWKDMFTGLLSALKRLARNPVFVFLAINTVLTVFGHFGPAIMLPKYMENQFRLSASDASLFSGATSIACIMVATVFGGFLIWKYRPTAKMLLAGMIASEFILVVGYLILTIPGCEKHQMMHFGSNDRGMILDSVCNQNCSCSVTSFTPFCGSDGKTMYFSPCYAGCTQQLKSVVSDKERMEFGNCSCVADAVGDMGGKITEGFCPDDNCWTQALAYICLMLTQVTISNTLTVAHTMILLRSVHPNDKSVALGTFETFICLFGFIPFPITFGALVDSACLVWEKSCGETGNCWFYDLDKYNYFLHGAASLFCAIAVCCLTILYCLSARIRSLYKDEEDEQEDYQINIKLDTVSGTVTKL